VRCATTPELRPVVSSAVAATGYDEAAEEAYVEFIESGTYVYERVPRAIWQAFEAADSKGGFVNDVLKPFFPYRKA
jgi:ADP-ribosylglycohydrolase